MKDQSFKEDISLKHMTSVELADAPPPPLTYDLPPLQYSHSLNHLRNHTLNNNNIHNRTVYSSPASPPSSDELIHHQHQQQQASQEPRSTSWLSYVAPKLNRRAESPTPPPLPSVNNLFAPLPDTLTEDIEHSLERKPTFWNSGAMGLGVLGKGFEVKAPQGWRVERTAKGQPYFVKLDDNETKLVQEEYSIDRLSLFSSWATIEEKFGLGVKLYFDFSRALIVLNSLFLFIQSINFLCYIAVDFNPILSEVSNVSFGVLTEVLYASNYNSSLVWVWRVTNMITIVISLLFGPAYWLFTQRVFTKRSLTDVEERFIRDEEGDIIEENRNYGKWQRVARMTVSYAVFILLLVFTLVCVAGLTFLQNFTAIYKVIGGGRTIASNQFILTPISFGISIIVGIVNFSWGRICRRLTMFEKHLHWSSFRSHNTFKLIFFKLMSVFLMGFAKGFFAVPCILTVLGNQYLVQILIDIFVFNSFELFVPWFRSKLKRKGMGSDESTLPEFDVAEEYLELIYRQYVVYSGMAAFPMMSLIGCFASILELYLDKFRLLKICRKPPKTNGSIKTLVAFFLLLSALFSMLNWGGGSLYSIVGFYWCNRSSGVEACGTCTIFDGVKGTGFVRNLISKWKI